MKRIISLLLTGILAITSIELNAQEETPAATTPEWVSEKGYWVVESNKKTPKDATVYFYTNDHQMVYKEEVKGRKLKLNRNKTLLHLKAVLEEAITSHEKGSWAHQTNRLTQLLQE